MAASTRHQDFLNKKSQIMIIKELYYETHFSDHSLDRSTFLCILKVQ